MLVDAYLDDEEGRLGLDERLKIGEALLGTVEKLGKALVGGTARRVGEGMVGVVSRRRRRVGGGGGGLNRRRRRRRSMTMVSRLQKRGRGSGIISIRWWRGGPQEGMWKI